MTKLTSKHKSRRLRRFAKASEAVSALEYAILVGVVAVGIGAALYTFTDNIDTAIATIGSDVAGLTGPGTITVAPPAPSPF